VPDRTPDRDEVLAALQKLPPAELHQVLGAIVMDPRVRRREGLRGFWLRYAGSIAFVAVVIFCAAGLFYVQHYSKQVNDSTQTLQMGLIKGCEENGNPLRAIVLRDKKREIEKIRKQIRQTRHADFAKFFPNLTSRRAALLKHRQISQQRDQIRQDQHEIDTLHPVDCVSLYS
jgi:hypothetical protein